MFKNISHVHFVGIGGIGMSSIAIIMKGMGYHITGSDIRESFIIDNLKKNNISVKIGHSESNISNADIVVFSSAVKDDNPEIIAAHSKSIPVIQRADMLAELMRMKYSIAVSGTHGKTTTTSIISKIMHYAELDPTMIVGGIVKSMDNNNAKLGKGKFLVAEADESDKSFLRLYPHIVVITNIDEDHMDNYRDIEEIIGHFNQFASSIPFNGSIIVCKDNAYAMRAVKNIDRRIVTYGFSKNANIRADNITLNPLSSEFDFILNNIPLGRITIKIPGKHNILNTLASIGAVMEIGIDFDTIKAGAFEFDGVERRFDVIYSDKENRVLIIDDYAHHPEEIITAITSAENMGEFKVISIFQPHLYSRTKCLLKRFAQALILSDISIITDIYPAREKPIPGINGELLKNEINKLRTDNIHYIKEKSDLPQFLKQFNEKNTIFLFIGAGDINKYSNIFKKELENENNQ